MFADMRNKKASQTPAGTSRWEDYLERILELTIQRIRQGDRDAVP